MSTSNSSNTTKAVHASAQSTTSQSLNATANTAADNFSQRRHGGSGGSRSSPSPRNIQSQKKQHKPSKRFRLADEDAFAESGAMRSTNSRRGQTSITHLMNFTLPPRPQNQYSRYINNQSRRKNPAWGLGSGYHAVDKARYVHANNRFIVDPRGNYEAQSVDADIHLDWNDVLQILVSPQSQAVLSSQTEPLLTSESRLVVCPICLQAPVAPRMTKCGHIFCLPCLIAYMAVRSDDEPAFTPERKARWKKCPVCVDSIYLSDVRPVRWYTGQSMQEPVPNEDVVLRLMVRPAGSTLALPRDRGHGVVQGNDIPWHFAAEVMDYARIMRGTEDYMVAQYDAEVGEVQSREKEDELMYGDGDEWTKKAVKSIRDQKEKTRGMGNPPGTALQAPEPLPTRVPITFKSTSDDVPAMYMIQHELRSGRSSSSHSPIPVSTVSASPLANHLPLTPSQTTDSNDSGMLQNFSAKGKTQLPVNGLGSSLADYRNRNSHQQPSEYFFYQALPNHYLSSLDIRILRAAFGDYASFPTTILPRVERVSSDHPVDDVLRKRTRYLEHLPYGCEVNFLECDWTDVVEPEILEKFKPEIERRRKRNADKELREEKARVMAEKLEDERYAAARRKRLSASSLERPKPEDLFPLNHRVNGEAVEGDDDEVMASSPPWPARRGQGSAFASLASPSTSPSAPRTVWGTAAVAPPPSKKPIVAPAPKDSHDDGWLQDWEKDLLKGEEMIVQAQAMTVSDGDRVGAGGPGSSKKKKNKKITLMSTAARRGA